MIKLHVAVALAVGLLAGLVLPRPWQRSFLTSADGESVARFDVGAQ